MKFEVSTEVGIEIEAKALGRDYEMYKKNGPSFHDCGACVSMDVTAVLRISGELKFFEIEWLTVAVEIGEFKAVIWLLAFATQTSRPE